MNKIITLLLLTSIFINCKSTKNREVDGIFVNKTILGNEFLKFNSNHTNVQGLLWSIQIVTKHFAKE